MLRLLPIFLSLAGLGMAQTRTIPLNSVAAFKLYGVNAEVATYKGRQALHVTEKPGGANGEAAVVIPQSTFKNGAIEVDLAGAPAKGAGEGARGFVGLAFRALPDLSRFECFYLRPTNGRVDDQLRRNHSTQYISAPGFPWQKLRSENPGVYESYADMAPGEWTKVKIVVNGVKAQLFVQGAPQPALIVNDLKQAETAGMIGLWIGSGTDAYFSNLRVTP